MASRRTLAQQLGVVADFEDPRVDLEQYTTPPELAATIVHDADLRGDIEDRVVVDLGAGTGMLGLAAALRGPRLVLGLELDPDALQTALANERRVASQTVVEWINADATQPPIAPPHEETTVLMNPPFGAQHDNRGADRRFLAAAAELGGVSYSVHNADSREFVESFAADRGGTVTAAFAAELEIDHQFAFHEADSKAINAEVFRIEWTTQ